MQNRVRTLFSLSLCSSPASRSLGMHECSKLDCLLSSCRRKLLARAIRVEACHDERAPWGVWDVPIAALHMQVDITNVPRCPLLGACAKEG